MKNNKSITISFILLQIIFGAFSCTDNPTGNNILVPNSNGNEFDFRLTDFEPAWSPDGEKIAYVHGDTLESTTGIYLIDVDSSYKRILFAGARAYSPTWTPDGNWLVFVNNAQIFKIKANGDSLTQLTFEGRNFFPSVSADGNWIAFDNSNCGSGNELPPNNSCGVLIASIDGKNKRLISKYSRMPDWHPTEPKVIFVNRVVFEDGSVIGDTLWEYNIQSNERTSVTLLTGQNYDNRYPKYSPNGNHIAFTSQPNGGNTQIWIMLKEGSNAKQLTYTQGYACDFSPDGQKIVYTDSRSVSGSLWIMNSDGSNKKQFTFNN